MNVIQTGFIIMYLLLLYSFFFLLILKESKVKALSWAPISLMGTVPPVSDGVVGPAGSILPWACHM